MKLMIMGPTNDRSGRWQRNTQLDVDGCIIMDG
jgi:hypothetical protein